MEKKEISILFTNLLNTIDLILNSEFYTDKCDLIEVKVKIEEWYRNYKNSSSLKSINYKDLEFMDSDIMELFDEYIKTESVSNNYVERLSYDFNILLKKWKEEMIGGKIV